MIFHCTGSVNARATRRPTRRGDNIPSIADYAHHNEEAQAVWYAENRYDMGHADEIMDDEERIYDESEE